MLKITQKTNHDSMWFKVEEKGSHFVKLHIGRYGSKINTRNLANDVARAAVKKLADAMDKIVDAHEAADTGTYADLFKKLEIVDWNKVA